VRLEMKECDRGCAVPWVTVVLFGEVDLYEEINGEMCPPPDGYRVPLLMGIDLWWIEK